MNFFLLIDKLFQMGLNEDIDSDDKLIEEGEILSEYVTSLHRAENLDTLWRVGSSAVGIEELKSWL